MEKYVMKILCMSMSDKLKEVEILFKREENNKWKYRWRNESQSGGKCGN
jgi:hypothetical protein